MSKYLQLFNDLPNGLFENKRSFGIWAGRNFGLNTPTLQQIIIRRKNQKLDEQLKEMQSFRIKPKGDFVYSRPSKEYRCETFKCVREPVGFRHDFSNTHVKGYFCYECLERFRRMAGIRKPTTSGGVLSRAGGLY